MKYLIDRLIIFNSDDGTLQLPSSEDVIKLALPAARLLETFLSSEGKELTREYLLETVWDNHGLHASGSNLNQYVSILRRNLALLGCHELIVTLPKVGFKFNAAIHVEVMEVSAAPPASSQPHRRRFSPLQNRIILSLLTVFLIIAAVLGYAYYNDTVEGVTKLQTSDSLCDIHYVHNISEEESRLVLSKIMQVMKQKKIVCKKNDVVIYSNEASISNKDDTRELFSYCHAGKSQEVVSCDNFYHYKWNKNR